MRKHPLSRCEECPYRETGQFVPSLFPKKPIKLAVVGEAPGPQEAKTGIPFTGPSGELLNSVLKHHGIERDEVFLTNACLCRPFGPTEVPPKSALAACSTRLHSEISDSGCTKILAVGGTAAKALVDDSRTITRMRVGPSKPYVSNDNIRVFPTFHPAYCLRSPDSFPSFISDVGKIKGGHGSWTEPEYKVFNDPAVAREAVRRLATRTQHITLDIEASTEKDFDYTHPEEFDLLCVGVGYARRKAVVFGYDAVHDPGFIGDFREYLSRVRIICHNGKFDLRALSPHVGVQTLWWDTMLSSYALDERPGGHGLKVLAVERLGAPQYDQEIKQYIPRGGSYASIPRSVLYKYNAMDVACTWDLYELFNSEFNENQRRAHDFMVAGANALIHLELAGIKFDEEYNKELDGEFVSRIDSIESSIHEVVGYEVNPRSVPQVTRYFYENGIRVKTTNKDYLKEIRPKINGNVGEFIDLLLHHRAETKLHGTYIRGLAKRTTHGKIYTTYLLHGTTSGRLASRNPNLQNICFSDDTEILTNHGWKLFKELDRTEEVAQWNHDGSIEFVNPEDYIELQYNGELINFKSGDHVDLLVTPDHRMISRARRQNKIFVESAKDYLKFGNIDKIVDRMIIRGGLKKGGISLSADERVGLERAIAYQAEACHFAGNFKDSGTIIVKSERKKKQLEQIFGDKVRHYNNDTYCVVLRHNDPDINLWLTLPSKNFKTQKVLELSIEDLEFFLSAIMRWDGDHTRGFTYLQREERRQSVEIVQAAATLCGKSTSLYKKSNEYVTVNIHPKPDRHFSRTNVETIPYAGVVYCVNVPSGAIVVRRNGTPVISGNCRNTPIRNQFTVEHQDNVLIQFDYKQAEGRVIATLAQDEYLRGIFSDPDRDIFDELATRIFGENWTKEQRVTIKTIFYGNAYGRKAPSIARALKIDHKLEISVMETTELMREFNALIPSVIEWQTKVKQRVLNGEDLITPFGRKRSFYLITNDNKEEVENEALSYLPQSIASDICLSSLIHLQPLLKDIATIRLSIHDALVVECHNSDIEKVTEIAKTEMIASGKRFTDYVPFVVDVSIGKRLGEFK